jgi:hypothetical protein
VTLTILGDTMTSDRSPHTARRVLGWKGWWEVSWLPESMLTRGQAVTAMALADATADDDVRPGHRLWPHITGWADELGGTAPEFVQQIARPPRWTRHQEKATGPLAPDQPHAEEPGPGWRNNPVFEFVREEEPDWVWDEAPDWACYERPDPGQPADTRPASMPSTGVSVWPRERYPHASENLPDTLRADRDPQPVPEPGNLPDWEAGQ